ncbi:MULTISPECIES: hypothetical protein [unclassified Streptomyces]|uniref:hypothetical protein n=1 Tax=unclassified Streptomyces TaxID=2593676 RepID=UPI00131E44EE|nr:MULTISPECIES: hypothetical protein [unclassified Streptomyces]
MTEEDTAGAVGVRHRSRAAARRFVEASAGDRTASPDGGLEPDRWARRQLASSPEASGARVVGGGEVSGVARAGELGSRRPQDCADLRGGHYGPYVLLRVLAQEVAGRVLKGEALFAAEEHHRDEQRAVVGVALGPVESAIRDRRARARAAAWRRDQPSGKAR